MAKRKKEMEGLPFRISICKEDVSPEEHKRRKVELFYFLMELGFKARSEGYNNKQNDSEVNN